MKLRGGDGERWVEGTVFEPEQPAARARSTASPIEAPLDGTLIVHGATTIGPASSATVGTMLGRHGVNIASFALGRDEQRRGRRGQRGRGRTACESAVTREVGKTCAARCRRMPRDRSKLSIADA